MGQHDVNMKALASAWGVSLQSAYRTWPIMTARLALLWSHDPERASLVFGEIGRRGLAWRRRGGESFDQAAEAGLLA